MPSISAWYFSFYRSKCQCLQCAYFRANRESCEIPRHRHIRAKILLNIDKRGLSLNDNICQGQRHWYRVPFCKYLPKYALQSRISGKQMLTRNFTMWSYNIVRYVARYRGISRDFARRSVRAKRIRILPDCIKPIRHNKQRYLGNTGAYHRTTSVPSRRVFFKTDEIISWKKESTKRQCQK